jgi:pimeloyl-ACP methyl ester carboxylesterase
MPRFDSDGVEIAYQVEGEGPAIVLVHGFAASIAMNWKVTGWLRTLTAAGRRVIALDCRGHGKSEKPHDPEAYAGDRMPADVIRLMDHISLERADLMGYSMGGMLSSYLLVHHPARFSSVVLAGIGGAAISRRSFDTEKVANALTASESGSIQGEVERAFRAFAEQGRNDLLALAAIMRSRRALVTPEELARVEKPVLVVVGEKDDLVGDPRVLKDAIPGSRLVRIPGKDHLTAVPDPRYKKAVLDFLSESKGQAHAASAMPKE